jgi:hypothetical protein
MKNTVLRSIINNTFLINYGSIDDYFKENNLVNNGLCVIDGGFTLRFCSSDAKELFEKNLKTQPDDWYYRTHEVKYTLNSLGYRTKEFDDIDWKESIVMFGCSLVFGIGVTDKHTIPYFLEQLSGRPVINMGISGSSIQTALHNSIILNDSKYPTPKAVVNILTELDRFHVYERDYVCHMGSWSKNFLSKEDYDIVYSKQNVIPFNLMNIKMIRNLWKNKTIYYEATLFGGDKLLNKLDDKICCHSPLSQSSAFEYSKDRARDLDHEGQIYNFKVAEEIYKKIKPQLDKIEEYAR